MITMGSSTARKCAVQVDGVKCGAQAYGPNANGRLRIHESEANLRTEVVDRTGIERSVGKIVPVCQFHLDMFEAARAGAATGGKSARRAAEAAMSAADSDTQEAMADRKPRFDALYRAAMASVTVEEFDKIQKMAARVASKANRGTVSEASYDDVLDQFVKRVAQVAFNPAYDLLTPADAVLNVDRAMELRGLTMVNATRRAARDVSYDSTVSKNSGANASEHGDAPFANILQDAEMIAAGRARRADTFTVADGKTITREELLERARGLMASADPAIREMAEDVLLADHFS
jgi:hypothetical protein